MATALDVLSSSHVSDDGSESSSSSLLLATLLAPLSLASVPSGPTLPTAARWHALSHNRMVPTPIEQCATIELAELASVLTPSLSIIAPKAFTLALPFAFLGVLHFDNHRSQPPSVPMLATLSSAVAKSMHEPILPPLARSVVVRSNHYYKNVITIGSKSPITVGFGNWK
jgi:hypothetical protein